MVTDDKGRNPCFDRGALPWLAVWAASCQLLSERVLEEFAPESTGLSGVLAGWGSLDSAESGLHAHEAIKQGRCSLSAWKGDGPGHLKSPLLIVQG